MKRLGLSLALGNTGLGQSAVTIASILGANILAWYKDPVAGSISSWTDSVGGDANKNAVQATGANQPTFNATDSNYNNKPTLTFGANQFLQTGIWATPMVGPTTIIVVGHPATNTASCYFVNSLVNNLGIFNSPSLVEITNQVNTMSSGVGDVTFPGIIIACFNGVSSTIAVRQNTPQATGNAGLGTATGITIGSYASTGFSLRGPIAEVLVVNGTISAPNTAAVSAILATKFALTQGA
jgi:hypothetical protein